MSEAKIQTQKVVNGVNVDQLFETIDAIKGNGVIARFKFRVRNRWMDGGHNQATMNDFDGACATHERPAPFVLDADEPPLLLGEDRGPNPVEYALSALSMCMTTGIVYHAAAHGYELEEVESRFEGDLNLKGFLGMDPEVRPGYEKVRVTFKVKAKGDVPDEILDDIVKYGPTYSPVHDIFTSSVPVEVTRDKS